MVKQQQPATYAAPEKNADDRWICSVDAKCTAVATGQAAYVCGGCEDVAATHADAIAKHSAELARHEQAIELIRDELKRRAEAGEDARLSAVEEVAVRLGMDTVQRLGADLEALKAAHAAVSAEHTHPVFACDKHADRLPE